MRITELQHDAEFEEAFPVIHELHHDLEEDRYRELVPEMRAAGCRMFAVREEDGLVAVVGAQKLTDLYYGRHLYVYDLSVTGGARSRGHGEGLLRHVEGGGREEGRGCVALACCRERDAALRFYEERMGYERPATPCASVAVVTPKAARPECPISARNGAARVGQSDS